MELGILQFPNNRLETLNVNSTPSAHTFFSCAQFVSVCCPGSRRHRHYTHYTSCSAQDEALCIVQKCSHHLAPCHTLHLWWTAHLHLAPALFPFPGHDLPQLPLISFPARLNPVQIPHMWVLAMWPNPQPLHCAKECEQWYPWEEISWKNWVPEIPEPNSFVIWKMNFTSEVCSSSSFPTEAMVWISEVNSSRIVHELKSSSSILRPNFDVLDSKIASALQKLLIADFTTASLHGRAKGTMGQTILERKTNRLHDHWILQTGEALLEFKDVVRVQLKNDNVQGFDTKWDEVLLAMTMKTCWKICT